MRFCGALLLIGPALCVSSLAAQNLSHPASASHGSHSTAYADSLAEFERQSRVGVSVFRDQSAAIAAGYRRIGMDFPSMGEHWVNTALLYQVGFDISTPALLSYAVIDGRPVLTGAVYAVLLGPGELPPEVPGGAGKWHDHSGTLNDESSLPVHHGEKSDLSKTRLMVLHAWVNIPNPDGLFEADNWALPYVRAGIPIPSPLSIPAARALSLLSGAKQYYEALAISAGAKSGAIVPALDSCATVAAPIAERMRATKSSGAADLAALEGAWQTTLEMISKDAGALVAARLNGGERVMH